MRTLILALLLLVGCSPFEPVADLPEVERAVPGADAWEFRERVHLYLRIPGSDIQRAPEIGATAVNAARAARPGALSYRVAIDAEMGGGVLRRIGSSKGLATGAVDWFQGDED